MDYDHLFSAPSDKKQQAPSVDHLFEDDPTIKANTNVRFGVEANPDDAANKVKLAKRYNMPVGVVGQFKQDFEQNAKADDAVSAIQNTPKLRKWIAEDPVRAEVTHDDLGNMGMLESGIRYLTSAPEAPRGGALSDVTKAVRSMAASVGDINAGLWGVAASPVEMLGMDQAGSWLRQQSATAKGVGNAIEGASKDEGFVEQSMRSGFRSAGQNLLLVPLGLAKTAYISSEAAVLGLMGLITGGQSYIKGREAGLNPYQATTYGIQDAAAEVVTEKYLGMAGFLKNVKAGAPAAKLFMYEICKEIPGEMAATLWQNFNEWGNVNPDKTLTEFLKEQPEALLQTVIATAVGGTTQIGAIKGVEKLLSAGQPEQQKSQVAEQHAQVLEGLQKTMEASKVLERSPDTLQSYMQDLLNDTGADKVYIDSAKLVEAGIDLTALAQVVPSISSQLDQVQTGGDIVIPTAELLTATVGTEFSQPLIDNARTDVNGYSRVEAQEFMKTGGDQINAEIERVLNEKQGDDAFRAGRDEIQQKILQQLNDTGRFSSKVNEQYASLAANFYAVMAARDGKSVQDFANSVKLGYKSETTTGDTVMDQPDQLAGMTEDEYISRINPDGKKRDFDQKMPATAFADLPANGRTIRKVELKSGLNIELQEGNGEYDGAMFAVVDGKVVGYMAPENGTTGLFVADEFRGSGIGEELSTAYRTKNPFAQSGGLSDAGEAIARKAFRRITADANDPNILNQSMSSRLPGGKKATEDPLDSVLNITFDVVLSDPVSLAKNVAALQQLPNMRKLKGKGAKDDVKNVEAFIQHATDNLLWLHDHMPAEMRDRAHLWYDGGRKTVEAWANRYGISEMQGAAAIAVLSPQNGWFANVSQAERIADVVFGLRDFAWDDAMTAEATRISSEDGMDEKMQAAVGKTLGELLATPDIAARWARVYDQTHNNRSYRVLTPEGGAAGYVQTGAGNDATMMWKSYSTIAKAISVLTDGRAENVYYQIGKEHKVRNFYNNIFAPNSDKGFATIDTHAVAAALLRPLASADIEVAQAFGGGGSSSSLATGLNGTYPIYLEAYRRAAEARGILPREMQSITWEAVRGLFEAAKKSGLKKPANAIWERYKAGEIEVEQAREEILKLAGDITPPSWVEVPFNDTPSRTYEGPAQKAIDERGDVGAKESGVAKMMFEVAPDPTDAKLTAEWNALSPEVRLQLSQQVAGQIVPKVLKELGTDGDFTLQLGGYLGATNPSMTLRVARPELTIQAAKLLGHALAQDSMMVVSETKIVGSEAVGAITIAMPDGYGEAEVSALYDKLWQLEDNGKKLVGGHTTADGQMVILNYSELTREKLADVIDAHLGNQFAIGTHEVYSAFPAKKDYGYASDESPTGDTTPRKSPAQRRPNNLRAEATKLLREALDAASTTTYGQGEVNGRPEPTGDRGGRDQSGRLAPLEGAPSVPGFHGPDPRVVAVAEQYARDNGIELKRQSEYVKVDPERGKRIADAYEAMVHAPQDPAVKEAYQNLINQTVSQYKALEAAGYKFHFIDLNTPEGQDYASTPWNAMRDTRENQRMGVFSTVAGFGSDEDFSPEANPLLEDTGFEWPMGPDGTQMQKVLANDLFRAVHDAFGHGMEGAGFRAQGEENAWQAHVRLFTGSAVAAITSETRGQNSWLNYGPNGDSNRTAKVEDTVFADQKTGLMPEWTWTEGRVGDRVDDNGEANGRDSGTDGRGGQSQSGGVYKQDLRSTVGGKSPAEGWIGATRVRGAEGPRTVYRGAAQPLAAADFGTDRLGVASGNPSSGLGVWFTTGKSEASSYGAAEPMQLDVRKPKVIRFDELPGFDSVEEATAYREELRAQGHDGIFLHGKGLGKDEVHIVAFEPSQAVYPQRSYEQPARGQISFGNDITQQTTVISLLKDADLSTFIHEGGHFFLEVMADLAKRISIQAANGQEVSPGQQSIVDDFNTTLAWMGVTGDENMTPIDQWSMMDIEQKRPLHEQFARGFEAYAFEGKSPSLELQKLFQTFRAWLVNVYRTIKQSMIGDVLDVKLNDEVRAVMDRMLATTEQIQQAEAARSMGPLFETPESAGMTPEEYKGYHDQGVQATKDAIDGLQSRSLQDLQWLQNARSRKLKEMQKVHDALRSQIRREEAARVMSEPIYQVWAFLTSKGGDKTVAGVTDMGSTDLATAAGKLRTQVLRDMYGTADDAVWRQLSALRMTSDENGLHPDIVAETFGFNSADQLVKALALAEPPAKIIDELTDQRMLQEHGDLATPAGIERAADAAIHNDARIRFVATELRAAQAAMTRAAKVPGRKNTVDLIVLAAKEHATKVINRLMVRDLRPTQYAAAEARSARLAQKSAGDLAKVAEHKRNQLVNMYAAKQAYKAQDDITAALEYFKRVQKPGSIPAKHHEQIVTLLSKFDLHRGTPLSSLDNTAKFRTWAKSQLDAGMIPPNVEMLLSAQQRGRYLDEISQRNEDGELIHPNEEDQALVLAGYIDELAVRHYKDVTVEELMGLRDTIKQIEYIGRRTKKVLTDRKNREFEAVITRMRERIEDVAEKTGRVAGDTRTPNNKAGQEKLSWRGFFMSHIKAANMLHIMDGGDGGPMWEHLMMTANDAANAEVLEMSTAHDEIQRLLKSVKEVGKITDQAKFFPSINRSLNRQARIVMALNMGNSSNMQRLLDGEGWTLESIKPVLDTLNESDWKFVQGMWDHFESYRERVGEMEKLINGVEPEWIEARQLKVETADGKTLTLRGGYAPVIFDPRASGKAATHAAEKDAKSLLQAARVASTVSKSFTKARVEEVKGRPLLLSLDAMIGGVQDTIHYLNWQTWIIDANRMIKALDEPIRTYYGAEYVKQLRDWAGDNAAGMRPARDAAERKVVALARNVSFAGLAFNVMSAVKQVTGYSQSSAVIGAKWLGRGAARTLVNPAKAYREAVELSTFMRKRATTRMRDLAEVNNTIQDQGVVRNALDSGGYAMMLAMQTAVDVPTWWGAYEKAIDAGRDDEMAVSMADQAVIDSQGSGLQKDLASVERATGAIRLLTGFMSFMNTTMNANYRVLKSDQSVGAKASDLLMINTVPVILGIVLANVFTPGGGEDDPEKLAKKFATDQVGFILGQMVGLREIAQLGSAFVGDPSGDYGGAVGTRMAADILKLAKQVGQGEMDDALRKSLVNAAGDIMRLPSAQINRTITGFNALKDGETTNPAALAFGFQKQK